MERELVLVRGRSRSRSQAQKVGRKSKTVYSEIPSEGKTDGSDLFGSGSDFFKSILFVGFFVLRVAAHSPSFSGNMVP